MNKNTLLLEPTSYSILNNKYSTLPEILLNKKKDEVYKQHLAEGDLYSLYGSGIPSTLSNSAPEYQEKINDFYKNTYVFQLRLIAIIGALLIFILGPSDNTVITLDSIYLGKYFLIKIILILGLKYLYDSVKSTNSFNIPFDKIYSLSVSMGIPSIGYIGKAGGIDGEQIAENSIIFKKVMNIILATAKQNLFFSKTLLIGYIVLAAIILPILQYTAIIIYNIVTKIVIPIF